MARLLGGWIGSGPGLGAGGGTGGVGSIGLGGGGGPGGAATSARTFAASAASPTAVRCQRSESSASGPAAIAACASSRVHGWPDREYAGELWTRPGTTPVGTLSPVVVLPRAGATNPA